MVYGIVSRKCSNNLYFFGKIANYRNVYEFGVCNTFEYISGKNKEVIKKKKY